MKNSVEDLETLNRMLGSKGIDSTEDLHKSSKTAKTINIPKSVETMFNYVN